MAIKKFKINKEVKEIDFFLKNSIKREKAVQILNKNCNSFKGYYNVFSNHDSCPIIRLNVIIESMIEYGELMSRAKN